MKKRKISVFLLLTVLIFTFLTGCAEPVSEEITAWKDAGFRITKATTQVKEAMDLTALTKKEFAHTGSAILAESYQECALEYMNELTKNGGIYLNGYMYDKSSANEYSFYQLMVFPWGFVELNQLSISDNMSIDYYEMKNPEVTADAMAETLIFDEIVVVSDQQTGLFPDSTFAE